MNREIVVVGLSHHTAPVETREQLAIAEDQLAEAYKRLLGGPHLEEGVILSTCNRVEVVVAAQHPDVAASEVVEFLRQSPETDVKGFEEHLYVHRGPEAVRHVFRVASSLDSMVVGEPQILGQLKDSYSRAAGLGATGTVLHRLFHKSFSAAKRVRAETSIASRAVSVSSAAVDLARQIFERLEDKTAMLIGAGQMSELAAKHLLANGVGNLIATNRTFERAVELSREFGGTPVPFDQFQRYLKLADVVIGSTAADDFVITAAMVHEVLRERNQQPMFFIDLSVPRNFDPRINQIDNVYLYDVDDLEGVIEVNLEERAREAEKAERLVEEEVDAFCRWIGSLNAVPTIVALRRRVEAIRRAELDKTLSSLRHLGERERDALEAMTAAIVNKILHAPISKLKRSDDGEDEAFFIDAVMRLFALDDEPQEGASGKVTRLPTRRRQ
jgi:glutamyl-tRNA reductase